MFEFEAGTAENQGHGKGCGPEFAEGGVKAQGVLFLGAVFWVRWGSGWP